MIQTTAEQMAFYLVEDYEAGKALPGMSPREALIHRITRLARREAVEIAVSIVDGLKVLPPPLPEAEQYLTNSALRMLIPASSVSSILCDHANEAPTWCHCPGTCYCKQHTCRAFDRNQRTVP